ncbi:uncharacterized protein LOC102075991 isoform X2 [Oreochromis niloticus]|uniref:uncharacterized protein LOC102075991 isoform X2 n=1 Tax=Oreochromis niloticus TaxID=8128 RepID=UPI00067497B0|nr:uncharacterized protein LOC102075991 isoform X2 [Oreochromis niloticus]CAI5673267.1 unnamed protein product [Mustela putorius furo]
MWVTLSCFDRCWTADTLVDELAIFLQDCPLSGVKTKTEKAGKMGTFDATRSVSSASTHLHHCHISWSQGCEVIQTSGPSAMFSKVPPDKPDLSLAVNVPQHVDGLLPVGPTPSAAVSTVKRKGQRGDIQFGVCFKPEAYRRLDVNLHHHRSILTQKWQQSGPSAALLLLPNRKPIEAQSAGLFQPCKWISPIPPRAAIVPAGMDASPYEEWKEEGAETRKTVEPLQPLQKPSAYESPAQPCEL